MKSIINQKKKKYQWTYSEKRYEIEMPSFKKKFYQMFTKWDHT